MKSQKYIYDTLYGKIYLDPIVWEVFTAPELQRLREVRLCNINSLCLPGGANINRFEHALGTVYLAQKCIEDWPLITDKEKKHFLLSALFHDSANAAFGHSVEYIEAEYGYNPERDFKRAVIGLKANTNGAYSYKILAHESFFFGVKRKLSSYISHALIEEIGETIRGEGKFGPLISGSMDLDNIDNIYRLAYHIGIINKSDTPIKLAKSIWTENGKLIIRDDAIPYAEEWYKVRRNLYLLLLENPEEFSAKCMLTEAIEIEKDIRKREESSNSISWNDTDYSVLMKLNNLPSREIEFTLSTDSLSSINTIDKLKLFIQKKYKNYQAINEIEYLVKYGNQHIYFKLIDGEVKKTVKYSKKFEPKILIERLMTGDLFPCINILSTSNINAYEDYLNFESKTNIELEINNNIQSIKEKKYNIVLHPIKDVNKTERILQLTGESGKTYTIGNSSNRLLIGIFIRNNSATMHKLNTDNPSFNVIKKDLFNYFSKKLDDPYLTELTLYSEASNLWDIN